MILHKIVIWLCESALIAPFIGKVTIEEWATEVSKIAPTPDGIIAAAVVNSFAKNWESWQGGFELLKGGFSTRDKDQDRVFNDKFDIEVKYNKTIPSHYHHSQDYYTISGILEMKINGVPIERGEANFIWRSWCEIKTAKQKAELAAAEALRKMKLNEQKWDLVEKVVGLKRNEYGALEPIVKVEHEL